jgi:diguanylate cyclase (GGDEF)-like protein
MARCIVNVVLFDLDAFKHVNDTYGHLAGDRVLRDIGSLFDHDTRAEDLIARYGGDEFVLCVPHLELEDLQRMVDRLAGHVRALQWSTGEETFTIGVTTGLASSRLMDQPTLAQLLAAADRDLYRNKSHAHAARDVHIELIAPRNASSAGNAAATPAQANPSPVRKRQQN